MASLLTWQLSNQDRRLCAIACVSEAGDAAAKATQAAKRQAIVVVENMTSCFSRGRDDFWAFLTFAKDLLAKYLHPLAPV